MVHFPYEENLLKRYVFKYLLGLFYKVASFFTVITPMHKYRLAGRSSIPIRDNFELSPFYFISITSSSNTATHL